MIIKTTIVPMQPPPSFLAPYPAMSAFINLFIMLLLSLCKVRKTLYIYNRYYFNKNHNKKRLLLAASFSYCFNIDLLFIVSIIVKKDVRCFFALVLRNPFFFKIWLSLLKKCISPFFSLISHISQAGCLSCKNLLPYHAVICKIHSKFQHFDRSW